jgi:hypothetical protein
LKVELPPTATAGHSVDFDVTAVDDYGNTTPSYVDFVHFSSGDPDATLPANGPLTDGSGTFPVTFKTAGNQGVIATDTVTPSITGSDGGVISADAATHLVVDAPPTATGGQPFNVSVTATDAYGNTDKAYSGTVHLSSSDGAAVLPADSTLTNGTKTFGVTLTTTGNQTVTATDAETASITGTSGSVTVSKIETTTTAGSTPTSLTATVTSGAGTPTGSVTFTVNGTQVGSPVALSSGVATVAYTLGTGTQTITATYGGSASFTGSSDQSVVTPPIVTAALSSAHPATPYGWYRDAVHITFSCQEGSAPVTCPSAVTVGTQGKAQSVSRTAVASDGGRASVTAVLSIDKHQPSLRLKGLKPGHTYRHAPHPKCKAKDSLSGIASCTIATHQHGKTVTVIATALDKAGNDSRLKAQYDLAKGTKA